ncbi:MAG: hypothetical protein HC889_08530 [Synechococcaceae cyanobacterium SM1_2_3]|nr:hypothetical protein [Synechococcaceae cyanobacterium SM1_2_3]
MSTRILTTAQENKLEPLSFLVNVAAVLASSALAAQPENQLQTASRHIQDALGLVHCLRDDETAPSANKPLINAKALQ